MEMSLSSGHEILGDREDPQQYTHIYSIVQMRVAISTIPIDSTIKQHA
jgi:hypothetical protein